MAQQQQLLHPTIYTVGPDGQLLVPSEMIPALLKSNCGSQADFDDYVRRVIAAPDPYFPLFPSSRNVDTLWPGRRCRLYDTADQYHDATVRSWRQYKLDPAAPVTSWELRLLLETEEGSSHSSLFETGDTILMHGLKAAPHLNGREATIMEFLGADVGRYKVLFVEPDAARRRNQPTFVAVQPQNLKKVTTYRVNRMNVQGGGTLIGSQHPDRLISLEWLDHAVAPEIITIDDPPDAATNDGESLLLPNPIINSPASVTADPGTETVPPPPRPTFDPDELQRQRYEYDQEFARLVPFEQGGTATRLGDSKETVDEAMRIFMETVHEVVADLTEKAAHMNDDDEGLRLYWHAVLTVSIRCFMNETFLIGLRDKLNIPALEILVQAFAEREDECAAAVFLTTSSHHYVHVFFKIFGIYTQKIGELYEEESNYRAAIPWYEQMVLLAKQRVPHFPPGEDLTAPFIDIGAACTSLGLAQKRAGFLVKAMETYNDGLLIVPESEHLLFNRQKLLREMGDWIGSSGKLTPGC
jgi:hypothetical protein